MCLSLGSKIHEEILTVICLPPHDSHVIHCVRRTCSWSAGTSSLSGGQSLASCWKRCPIFHVLRGCSEVPLIRSNCFDPLSRIFNRLPHHSAGYSDSLLLPVCVSGSPVRGRQGIERTEKESTGKNTNNNKKKKKEGKEDADQIVYFASAVLFPAVLFFLSPSFRSFLPSNSVFLPLVLRVSSFPLISHVTV